MTGHDPDDAPRPIRTDQYPDPVLEYARTDGRFVARSANDAARSELGVVREGTSIEEVFDRAGVTVLGEASVGDHIDRGDRFRVRVREDTGPGSTVTREYLVRPLADPDGAGGHLAFVDASDLSPGEQGDDADALGVDGVASVVSHDLRNPLDVAMAHLRAARETGEDEHFDRVARAHDRMERIVRDVLTLVRGDEAVTPSESVDVGSVAREAWATVDTGDATLAVDGDLPTVTVDPDRTKRLFENLFRNAVEHAGDAPSVRVGPLSSEGEGFYVADDGPGIPAADRRAVFEPGYSTHDHGTGLGLPIVERIASAHGWAIAVTGSADGGARFEVEVDGEGDPEE